MLVLQLHFVLLFHAILFINFCSLLRFVLSRKSIHISCHEIKLHVYVLCLRFSVIFLCKIGHTQLVNTFWSFASH